MTLCGVVVAVVGTVSAGAGEIVVLVLVVETGSEVEEEVVQSTVTFSA
jgi:hypothetical protein